MKKIINDHEAKTQFSRLLERAHAGEEVIVHKAGKPYARLMPLASPGKRRLGFMQGKVDDSLFDPLPEEEQDAWDDA